MNFAVSVIIPFYNSGDYLIEAIKSVEDSITTYKYEIIIIDDGSTDKQSKELLNNLSVKGYKVLSKANGGPASARNFGVEAASGEYLLFLDSDNKIRSNFIGYAADVLAKNSHIGVVYGNAHFFGDTLYSFNTECYDRAKLYLGNYIDMCAMIKKELWEEVGPLDENTLLIGHEDWDYWLRVGCTNWEFHFTDQILFDYRIRKGSLLREVIHSGAYIKTKEYLYNKHLDSFIASYLSLYQEYDFNKTSPTRSFARSLYHKYKRAFFKRKKLII